MMCIPPRKTNVRRIPHFHRCCQLCRAVLLTNARRSKTRNNITIKRRVSHPSFLHDNTFVRSSGPRSHPTQTSRW